MTFLLELLGKWGVPPEMRRLLLGVLGTGIVVIVIIIGMHFHDNKVIDNHDAGINLDAATQDRKADTRAADRRVADETRLMQEHQELKEVLDDPTKTTERDRNLAFHRCLRLQQAARADGKQPPACL